MTLDRIVSNWSSPRGPRGKTRTGPTEIWDRRGTGVECARDYGRLMWRGVRRIHSNGRGFFRWDQRLEEPLVSLVTLLSSHGRDLGGLVAKPLLSSPTPVGITSGVSPTGLLLPLLRRRSETRSDGHEVVKEQWLPDRLTLRLKQLNISHTRRFPLSQYDE